MVFLTESWFWRGTQSAVFYYLSCSPLAERKQKSKLRKQAARAREEKENSPIYAQPGVIRQPDPFQTNEEWAQEIVEGPGPPKGWKRDSIYFKHARKFQRGDAEEAQSRSRGITVTSTESPAKSVFTGITDASTVVDVQSNAEVSVKNFPGIDPASIGSVGGSTSQIATGPNQSSGHEGRSSDDLAYGLKVLASRGTDTTGSKRSSFASESTVERRASAPRPSLDRRLSTAMDGFKETMRAALHPEHWNWIRYDRDDEILSNINERMKGMWDNVKGHMTFPPDEQTSKLPQPQPPAETVSIENEVKIWQRGTHPVVNDLSPPIVSQLPYTKEEAQWMLLPPPSADTMMGRSRPDFFDDINRKPLCIIGRPIPEAEIPVVVRASPTISDDDETENSEAENEWPVGWVHLQKPQRAYLYPRRAPYGGEVR